MFDTRRGPGSSDRAHSEGTGSETSPGKVTLTQRMRRGPSIDAIADAVVQRLARGTGGGAPLPGPVRGRFEQSLGTDLGSVRVHSGGDAADAASAAGARAFALGQDVYFGSGNYDPDSDAGQHLLAHEVAHTVQQRDAEPTPQFALEVSQSGDACEDNADSLAAAMVSGAPAGPVTRAPVQRIARRRPDEAPAAPTLPYPGIDVVLEQIAHRIVYDYRDADAETLRGWGYQPSPPLDLPGDLQLMCLLPLPGRRDVAPVMAFRGTASGADAIEDFNAGGVGMFQFFRNEALIVQKLQVLGGGVTATGHSLGGALAQIAAATHPDLVNRVVTFQAPGINPSLIEGMRATEAGRAVESRHHIVDGCIVSPSGGAHTMGETIRHHRSTDDDEASPDLAGPGLRSPILEGAFEAHTSMPLAEEASAAGAMPAGGAFGEGGTRAGFDAPTVETGDSAVGVAELGREALGVAFGDRTESAYVAAWVHLRAQAASGSVRYSVLTAEIAAASLLADAGLQENLDAMFPDLRAADRLEERVRSGEITSADAFVAAVGLSVDLDDVRRARMAAYYQAILRDAGLVARLEAAFDAMVEYGAGPMMPMRLARGSVTPVDPSGIASRGVAGGGGALPHLDAIQTAFGRHDVSGVSAHQGGEAAEAARALDAHAYAFGGAVAFDGAPDLHTAAHEATHVVQQRGGVQLRGAMSEPGDEHEVHADAVADAVVRGESAEALLDTYAGGAGGVQRVVQRLHAEGRAATSTVMFRLGNATDGQLDLLRALLSDAVSSTLPTFSLAFELGSERLDLVDIPHGDAQTLLDAVTSQMAEDARRARAASREGGTHEVHVGAVEDLIGILDTVIAAAAGLRGDAADLEMIAHIPLTLVSAVVGLHLQIEHGEEGYRVVAEPQVGLGMLSVPGPVQEHLDAMAGYRIEAQGHDSRIAAQLIVNGLEHSLNSLLGVIGGVTSEDEERAGREGMTEDDFVDTSLGISGRGTSTAASTPTDPSVSVDVSAGVSQHWRAAGEDGAEEMAYQTFDFHTRDTIHHCGIELEAHAVLRTGTLLPGEHAPDSFKLKFFGAVHTDGLNAWALSMFTTCVELLIEAASTAGAHSIVTAAQAARNRAAIIGAMVEDGVIGAGVGGAHLGLGVELSGSTHGPTVLAVALESEAELHLGVFDTEFQHMHELFRHEVS